MARLPITNPTMFRFVDRTQRYEIKVLEHKLASLKRAPVKPVEPRFNTYPWPWRRGFSGTLPPSNPVRLHGRQESAE